MTMLVVISAAAKADWCGASDAENWREFSSLYSAGMRVTPGRPTVYILGAPWCPVCKSVFQSLGARQYAFDARFIPVQQSGSERHAAQVADLASDGTPVALTRVYQQNSANADGLNAPQRSFIAEVQTVTDIVLQERFEKQGKKWGTPITFIYWEGIQVVYGQPNLEGIERILKDKPPLLPENTTRRFITSPMPLEKSMGRAVPFAKRDNTRLRILPDRNALSAICVAREQGAVPAGFVTIDGEDWIVFKPFRPDTSLRVYGLASDFELVGPRR
jgi:thiol-disulfide isomerase/thioredoxin